MPPVACKMTPACTQPAMTLRLHVQVAAVVCMFLLRTGAAQRGQQPRDCGDRSCYDVLGVHATANESEIKKAYRRLAKRWHPDKNTGADAELAQGRFTQIGNAYEILTDERASYDQMRRYGGGGGFHRGGFSGFHQQQQHHGHHDPFDEFIRRQQHAQGRYRTRTGMASSVLGAIFVPVLIFIIFMVWLLTKTSHEEQGNPYRHKKPDASRPPSEPPVGTLPDATPVRVKGLQNATQHNGSRATVVRYDAEKRRYIVQLAGIGGQGASTSAGLQLSLRKANLQQIVRRAQLLPAGIEPNADGGGFTFVDVENHDPDEQLYTVRIRRGVTPEHADSTLRYRGVDGGHETTRVSRARVLLPDKTCVCVVGVKSQPELNGRGGQIHSFDPKACRYRVWLGGDTWLSLLPSNVVC